jgi:hypothetical protein
VAALASIKRWSGLVGRLKQGRITLLHYIVGNAAQALPLSFVGLIAVFFFRKSITKAIVAGCLGSIILPLALLFSDDVTGSGALVFAAAIWGVLYGVIVGFVSRTIEAGRRERLRELNRINAKLSKPKNPPKAITRQQTNNAVNKETATPPSMLLVEKSVEKVQPSFVSPWSEEFQILYEYDPIVKECHDEIENIDQELSNQFREEVVSDRKKAADIRDRLKSEHERQSNPYQSNKLNTAFAQAKLLGKEAEDEFLQVIKVMGEDVDADLIIKRLSEKYDLRSNLHLLKSIVKAPHGEGYNVLNPKGNAYLRKFNTPEDAYRFMRDMKHPELKK